jgi:hypothetical protein
MIAAISGSGSCVSSDDRADRGADKAADGRGRDAEDGAANRAANGRGWPWGASRSKMREVWGGTVAAVGARQGAIQVRPETADSSPTSFERRDRALIRQAGRGSYGHGVAPGIDCDAVGELVSPGTILFVPC